MCNIIILVHTFSFWDCLGYKPSSLHSNLIQLQVNSFNTSICSVTLSTELVTCFNVHHPTRAELRDTLMYHYHTVRVVFMYNILLLIGPQDARLHLTFLGQLYASQSYGRIEAVHKHLGCNNLLFSSLHSYRFSISLHTDVDTKVVPMANVIV